MIAPGSRSYPFLALAQEWGVEYGDVLMAAELFRGKRLESERAEACYQAFKRLDTHVSGRVIRLIAEST